MNFSADIYYELNTISPFLAGIEKKNIFSVTEGYFDTLSLNILKKVKEEDTQYKLTVPKGYFENLSSAILNRIRSINEEEPAQELRALSPMLYSIQNEKVFQVPAGYFRNLEADILNKINPQAKVVEFNKARFVWKYAAAAVLTGVIAISSLLFFNSKDSKSIEQSVSSSVKTAAQFKNEQQVKSAIATLSDDEIIKYLEKTGTDVDNESLASGIDENALPAPADYLLDEKTLDNYIHENKNSQN